MTFRSMDVLNCMHSARLIPLRYVDDQGQPTEEYPLNPNGSPLGIAGVCSADGRHLAMMPHPERCILPWQWAWMPNSWRQSMRISPWLRMFQNACEWCLRYPEGQPWPSRPFLQPSECYLLYPLLATNHSLLLATDYKWSEKSSQPLYHGLKLAMSLSLSFCIVWVPPPNSSTSYWTENPWQDQRMDMHYLHWTQGVTLYIKERVEVETVWDQCNF